MYLDANNLHGWAMSQKSSIDGFKQVEDLSKLDESFIKNYNENNDKGYFLELDVEYPKKLFNLHRDLSFLPERKKKLKMREASLYCTKQKKLCCSHKCIKTSAKSRINTNKSTQGNTI